MSKGYYLTTAIPYVNGEPHIGHVMDYLLSDTYARYLKTHKHVPVRLQVGTDEHGNKIAKKAAASNLSTQSYVDANSANFKSFIKKLGVEYTDFIRTTDADHERRVQKIWQKLTDHIYKNTYEGWYCEGCESFVTQKEYDANGGTCPNHQKPYEKVSEENYYLRISDFKDEIKTKIENDEMKIVPEFRKKEVLKLIADSPDVSISRPKEHLSWGVPVPDDEDQTMYVWMDALANYITVLGYPENDISNFWPADVQFVGKDILRFHAIIWPAILLGLGLELPRVLHSHGFILTNGAKMSKSVGNVVDPLAVIDRHGLPAFRYFFLRHVDTFLDANFSAEQFEDAYNNELANDLGNLVQRLAVMCKKQDLSGIEFSPSEDETYRSFMDELHFSYAFNYAWEKIQAINKRIDETKPWELNKAGKIEELKVLLKSLVKDLLQCSYLIAPFLPETSAEINAVFANPSAKIAPSAPLFPKLTSA